MRILNAPVPGDGGGVPFDDLIAHFVIGGDEACLMASATGVVKVLGDKSKIKHEIIMNDSRASMSVLRTAATGDATGPTYFLMEGVKTKWVPLFQMWVPLSCSGFPSALLWVPFFL